MSETKAIGVRLREDEQLRIEVAAAVEGKSRSRFIAEAATNEARRRLRAANEEAERRQEND